MTAPSPGSRPGGLGLVLSSGAACGAAHVGVIQALEAAGFPVPVVAGTSAGALVGAGWAAGITAAEIAEWVSRATWADFGSPRLNRRLGLLDTTVLRANLDEALAGRRIEHFPRRFGAVATDVLARTPVLIDRGPATDAVCASIAVPGLFPPVRIQGRMLFDGGIASPMPVWAARRLGAPTIVAISLAPETPSRARPWRSRVMPPIPNDGPADLEILINTREYSAWSPRDVSKLIDLGRRTTEHLLEEINALMLGTHVQTDDGEQPMPLHSPDRAPTVGATRDRPIAIVPLAPVARVPQRFFTNAQRASQR